jgi:general secretion pathway protein A
MYTKFFGLKEKPFEITPDPRFLYSSANHKNALAHLIYAINEKRGFTVITGEVGTGKTLLVQTLLNRLNGNRQVAYLFNPQLGTEDFFQAICEEYEIKVEKGTKGEYLNHLHQFLLNCHTQNTNAILIIDEAHTLNPNLLEEIRLLGNLETTKIKLLQVILLGQLELEQILKDPKFRPLKQRITVRYHMQPLSLEETREYIKTRLRTAGAMDLSIFTSRAMKKIYKYSKGIPRLINIVCDQALLSGYANDQKKIDRRIIADVIRDLEQSSRPQKKRLFLLWISLLVILGLGVLILWRRDDFLYYWDRLGTMGIRQIIESIMSRMGIAISNLKFII